MSDLFLLIIAILVAGFIGFLSRKILKSNKNGCVGNVVIGFMGMFIGGAIASVLGIGKSNLLGATIFAVLGGVIFLYLVRKIF